VAAISNKETSVALASKDRTLSNAEWQIMKVLWEHGDMALGEVIVKLPRESDWAYTTVKTFIRRMVQKGWVSARKVGGSYLYQAKIARQKAIGQAIKEFSHRVLNGVLTPFVAYYAENNGLTRQEIEELQKILDGCRKKGVRRT
jgi:BlaI family transcriptional regulator, penicillinase repressor